MTKHQQDFEIALGECLDAIKTTDRSIDECLAAYPNYAQELEPLLRVAWQLHSARRMQPSLHFRRHAPQHLQKRLESSRRTPVRMEQRRPDSGKSLAVLPGWQRLVAKMSLALIVVIMIAGLTGMAAYAADDAAPGDVLYGVDRAVERVQLQLADSPHELVLLQLRFAEERLAEAEDLAVAGKAQQLDEAVAGYEEAIRSATETAINNEETEAAFVDASLSAHEERLEELLTTVPEPAKPGIERALTASQHEQERRSNASREARGQSDDADDKERGGNAGGKPNDRGGGPPDDRPGGGQGNGNGSGGNPGGGPPDDKPDNGAGGGNGKDN